MFTVQRIYAYQPNPEQAAVFIDRLYPRGVHKEVFATALWLKDITPSANLRRWYHENPAQNFDGFVRRQRPSTFPRLCAGSIFGRNV